jgi:G:T-mismatch repair DNA endonuclease (very short patch repair protein)
VKRILSEEHKKKISDALRGRPKPFMIGENNPNYGGKYIRIPEVKAKYLVAVQERGQGWDINAKLKHSERMRGSANWMRGKTHTETTKQRIRDKILDDFSSGRRALNRVSVSKAEREIFTILLSFGFVAQLGFRIPKVNKLYDICIPEKNLIIEYNGDYWHMNPRKYSEGQYNKVAHKTAKEIWERDDLKKQEAIFHGFYVAYIWEMDYNGETDKKKFVQDFMQKI